VIAGVLLVVQPMIHSAELMPSPSEVLSVALADLTVGNSFRETGLNDDHVQGLVALSGRWPPVLVNRSDGLVIDGAHRVEAARVLGLTRIDVCYFDGGPDDALIEFVRRNVHQGLPLTLRERKRAAEHVLLAHPEWSDRRIAELCAISPKTVGRLRTDEAGSPTEGDIQLDRRTRVGRDNKWRPVHNASVRSRVAEAVRESPDASLRSIARSVGVSPETVRIVRMNTVAVSAPPVVESPQAPATKKPAEKSSPWKRDLALISSDDGEDFVVWFDRTTVAEDECWRYLDVVPMSRIYEVADEARRRSDVWLQFAKSLDKHWDRRKGR
jgi:ParB-like chromosome segregation protein Spo0J